MIAEMQSKATLDQIQNGPLPHVPGLDGIPSRKARDRAVEMAYGTCAKGMNRIFGGKFGSLNERFQDIQAQLDDRVTKQSLKTVVETMGNTMLAAFRQAWPTVFLESSADEADGGGDEVRNKGLQVELHAVFQIEPRPTGCAADGDGQDQCGQIETPDIVHSSHKGGALLFGFAQTFASGGYWP